MFAIWGFLVIFVALYYEDYGEAQDGGIMYSHNKFVKRCNQIFALFGFKYDFDI